VLHLVERRGERSEPWRRRAEARQYAVLSARKGALLKVVVDRDIRTAKAVDRLLGVADDGQAAGRRRKLAPIRARFLVARQQPRELRLHGVGVLELVDQHRLKAPAEVAAPGLLVPQQIARP